MTARRPGRARPGGARRGRTIRPLGESGLRAGPASPEQLTGQINELNQRLTRLVERHAPQLLAPVGIGPDSAVTLLITMGDNPERLSTEASFAELCGVSPVEYSSAVGVRAGSAKAKRMSRSLRGICRAAPGVSRTRSVFSAFWAGCEGATAKVTAAASASHITSAAAEPRSAPSLPKAGTSTMV
ncbi:transposase [Streptomyces sp. NPDC018610]|uniref:transposase n=1 Tax=Streptomyces sp. NPDC018610 TaxID=3365049 RepID=UPI0037B1A635